jgi:hypothetical protein
MESKTYECGQKTTNEMLENKALNEEEQRER